MRSYKYWKQRFRHAIRFRHKRGFGVHSPFMFNFILNTLRDKKSRFSYPIFKKEEQRLSGHKRKALKLLIRIIRTQHIESIFIDFYREDIVREYLMRAFPTLQFVKCIDNADLILLTKNSYTKEIEIFNDEKTRFLIIYGIHQDRKGIELNNRIIGQSKVYIDMMYLGLHIFNSKLQPGKYNILL